MVSLFSYCEEIPVEENEVNDSSSKSSIETKPDASPQLPKKSITNSTLTSTGSSEAPVSVGQSPLLLPCPAAVFPSLINSRDPTLGSRLWGGWLHCGRFIQRGLLEQMGTLHPNAYRIQSWVLMLWV